MPSFDIVSETNMQEVDNAVNMAKRDIIQRYDFKGSNASLERNDAEITIMGDNDYQQQTIADMLKANFVRRELDPKALDFEKPETASGNQIRQKITIKQGISQDFAKKITKAVKEEKLKVQASIRGEELRITGKKRDDLQDAIAHIKGMDLELPLQFTNFRD